MTIISNILQLWRFYWRTEKKTYLRIFLICFAIYLVKTAVFDFILMRISSEAYNYSHTALFYQMYSIGTLILMSYLFDDVHHKQRAISYLSLPASNIEKFLSRFIMGVVGVPILLNVALLAGSIVVTLVLGTIDSLAGNQASWMQIFDYYSHHPDLTATYDLYNNDLFGAMPLSMFLNILFWRNMMVLAFFSFFIWFGTAFRRAGWVYATIVIFVLLALFIFVLDFMGILHQPAPPILRYIWGYGVPLLSILFTYLAYRSFCRAQIVTHKFFTL